MKKLGWLGGVLVITALLFGGSSAGAAATTECGDYRSVEGLTADGISCGDAKKVVKVWIRLCGYEGRCVLEMDALGEQYACKGRKSGTTAKITCTGRDSGDRAKFTAPV